MSATAPTGFVGLGNMGAPMCANMAKAGVEFIVFDAAGTEERAPEGTRGVPSVAAMAASAETVFLCLPDGSVVSSVLDEIIAAGNRRTTCVVDMSTIGVSWAKRLFDHAREADIEYVDAPVSGGVAGARKATVSVMYAGSSETLERLRSRFEPMSANIFHMGEHAGQGQAMKLLNNFLSGTAMAATSEAMAFGMSQNLDMQTMLEVLNVSTGQNTATKDKFVNRVLTETYDAGFTCGQMNKDVGLYREGVGELGVASDVSEAVYAIWQKFLEGGPQADITSIYPFIRDGG